MPYTLDTSEFVIGGSEIVFPEASNRHGYFGLDESRYKYL